MLTVITIELIEENSAVSKRKTKMGFGEVMCSPTESARCFRRKTQWN
jgi:hypothetical protein